MIRIKFYAVLIALSSLPVYISAQTDFRKFSLDSFKLPDIDRKALELSGGILGDHNQYDLSSIGLTSKSSFLSQDLSLTYSRFKNRIDLQGSQSAHVSNDYSYSTGENFFIAGTRKRVQWNPQISFFVSQRKYRDNKFVLTGYDARLNYRYNRQDQEAIVPPPDILTSREYDLRTHISGTLGFGTGRLEGISFVTMAMFLLQDAESLGVDLSGLATADIYTFSARMAVVRNQRIFDERRMRIQELRQLYAFMVDRKWVLDDDPGFFTVLTDNWLYNDVFSRQSGRRWTYSFSPYADFANVTNKMESTPDSHISETVAGASVRVLFEKYDPKHLYSDFFRIHELSVNGVIAEDDTELTVNSGKFLETRFDNRIGRIWYPNNRTRINASTFADLSYFSFLDTPEFAAGSGQFAVRLGLSGSANYFISYKTRLVVGTNLIYAYTNGGDFFVFFPGQFGTNGESSGFNANVSATLTVSIF